MSFNPKAITRENILQAIDKIENENLNLIESTVHDVLINGKKYPPKEVMRYAHLMANGTKEWQPGGGEATNKYLEKFGFPILSKVGEISNPKDKFFENVIDRYKEILAKEGLVEEAYKWQMAESYKKKLNLSNFANESINLDYKNFVYSQFYSVRKDLLTKKTDGYITCYKVLLDESIALADRIDNFIKTVRELFQECYPGTKLGTHHDERAIATILSFNNPAEYPLYKYSFYNKLVEKLNYPKAKVGLKYVDYIEIVDDFVKNHLINETELIEDINNRLKAQEKPFYKDENLNMLAQDVLYRVLDFNKNRTFQQVVEELSVDFNEEDSNLYNFKIGELRYEQNKRKTQFAWLIDNQNIIGDIDAHYELFCKNGTIYVDIHFENPTYEERNNLSKMIVERMSNLSSKFELINWQNTQSIRYVGDKTTEDQIKTSDENVIDKIKTALQYYEEYIAEDIRKVKQNIATLNPNDMPEENDPIVLNQILFGPPGTGKTYRTIAEAIKIVDKAFYEANKDNRVLLQKRFNELLIDNWENPDGQIAFCTFHQSFSYEDFVEGIKPKVNYEDWSVFYEIEDGIFKRMSLLAENKYSDELFMNAFENFIKTQGNKRELELKLKRGSEFAVKVNNNNNLSILSRGSAENKNSLTKENLWLRFIGKSKGNGLKGYEESLNEYLDKMGFLSDVKQKNTKNYVLIIDEINRGNVASIFGELITLIETTKRAGEPEAIKAMLPYSKFQFEVPNNLYIIGTMNTSDRNIESLDTALRRRFHFKEMKSDSAIIKTQGKTKATEGVLNEDGIDLVKLLETINKRIEKLIDKDHKIGHSYFLDVEDKKTLVDAFKNKIIPLLEEYFFGDFGKIGLVLGNSFIEKEMVNANLFAKFDAYEEENINDLNGRANYSIRDSKDWDFKSIY